MLVHGGGAGADARGNWSGCLHLYAKDFRVIAVDMVGFGETDKPDPASYDYTQQNRNKHLATFIEVMDCQPTFIIGNSMGGATALGVAIHRPELLSKLILMGSAGVAVHNPDPGAMKALAGYDFTLDGMRRIVKSLSGSAYEVDEELVKYRYELTLEPNTRAALAAIQATTKKEGLTYPEESLRGIKIPTLVVGGKEDQIAILARTYRFLELLDNSWGFIVPHCGHWVMIERPNDFVSVTRAFLRTQSIGA